MEDIGDWKVSLKGYDSIEIQKKVLGAGVRWCSGHGEETTYPDAGRLVFSRGGLMHGSSYNLSESSGKELTVEELLRKLGSTQTETKEEQIMSMNKAEFEQLKLGDKVRIAEQRGSKGAYPAVGDICEVVELDPTDIDDLAVRVQWTQSNGESSMDWLRLLHVAPLSRKQLQANGAIKMNEPETLGNVFRIEVLYTDGSSYSIGGVKNFEQQVEDSEGNDCLEYTKRVNSDVEGTFRIKREDLAALVLRRDNGKTEIFEYSPKVVDTVSVRLQSDPVKTLITQEGAEKRRAKRAEKRAKGQASPQGKKAKAEQKSK